MFSDRIALSSAEIFEKEFKIDAKGYRYDIDNYSTFGYEEIYRGGKS